MPYLVIEDFKAGLDKRRLEQSSPAGALITLENAHINRGGEIEKAKAFISKFTIPAGTFGLAALGDLLYVFGSIADPGVPAGLLYQQLEHESGAAPAMSAFLRADVFANKLFVIAKYANDDVRPFYDEVLIAGFQTSSGTVFEELVINAALLVYKNKVYLVSDTNLLFSQSGNAAIFDEGATGSGLIDVSTQVANEAALNGLAAYQNSLAVFSKRNIHIWSTDPDPDAYAIIQILPNLGTNAPRSVVSFGDHDVFFLSDTGIRSLRAINSSLAAGVTDVGTPIDDLIIATMSGLSDDVIQSAVSAIEPKDGRCILSLGDTLFVFSYFYSSKISAWSTYVPGVNMTDFATIGSRLYARAGNQVYLYGGDNNDQYVAGAVVVETLIDARGIATWKNWTALDLICEGVWDVYVNSNPNTFDDPSKFTKTATVTEHTIDKLRISMQQQGPLLKMRFVHQGAGAARLSKIIVHYDQLSRSG